MKMKLKYSVYILAAGLAFTSCKKNLDLQPITSLAGNSAFKSIDDFDAALIGLYTDFRSASYYNGNHGTMTDIMTDNLYETNNSLVNFARIANWLYITNDGFMFNSFIQPYVAISDANIIISKIGEFKAQKPQKHNRILAQAYAARAIAHFDLLKSYANDLARNSTDVGISIKKDLAITLPPRNTVKEVYDQIYSDLQQALTLFADIDAPINSNTAKASIDATVAKAAMARVALYAGDYQTAIDFSTQAIAVVPVATRTQYAGIWSDASVADVIWAVQNNTAAEGQPTIQLITYVNPGARNTFGIHPSLINLYDKTNDIRFNTFYFIHSNAGGFQNYASQKFKGKAGSDNSVVNFKVFRSSEMLLIRAEARARLGGATEAQGLADLNQLRSLRITGATPLVLTGQALLNEIQNERRRELAIEGHRWYDLKRTTRTVNRPLTGIGNANPQVATSLPSSSPKWTWPIPQAEIDVNKSVTQNPGY